jgi:hypothetical protein
MEEIKIDEDFAIFTILYIEDQVWLAEKGHFQKQVLNANKNVKLYNIKKGKKKRR